MKRIILTVLTVILFLLLVLGVTAQLGWWPVNATAVPSHWEFSFGQAILQASLSHQTAGLTNPIWPRNDVLITGLKVFKMNCAGCHGSRGQRSQWGTQNFCPRDPQFADNPPHLSTAQMFIVIKQGIRYSEWVLGTE